MVTLLLARNTLDGGDGQNTDPQSIDYPNGLPKLTTLKWITPKNNIPNKSYLMFLATGILKLQSL